ncbi:hypothetical protein BEWA_037000 [Theileria equi strain WA]|uniref:Uncharacterized protein n=1 Tax=Theileria equi strain WA TaxID=1537102 RepID=L1LEF3_THEEQ|nr:hypothetical protein BEWA_037000 [Theileria equi strain WA]EKX73664.1 hypothetical protein BEWA_037000 [Theileria equi strain WA]|eukprot:XP_004833116.1 hypothetical protein BEWA_037000 [Theileria equi strain WA]
MRRNGKVLTLDLSKKPKEDGSAMTYGSNDTTFTVIKSDSGLPKGFFRHVYTPTNGPITLNRTLKDDYKIRGGFTGLNFIEDVESTSAYFWEGSKDKPILLGITAKGTSGDIETKYFSKGDRFWMNGPINGLDEQQALDHQNCNINHAIPIDIKEPTKDHANGKSTCLKTKTVQPYYKPKLPSGTNGIYEVESYNMPKGMKVSRVTYDNNPTNITTNDTISLLKIYTWNGDSLKHNNIPLLVEFKKSSDGKSEWYENIGKSSPYTSWKQILQPDVLSFYNLRGELTDDFTIKLNEINCNLNDVLQIDVRKQPNKKTEEYCHGRGNDGHIKKISVEPDNKINIPGFGAYKHYMKASLGSRKFNISGFTGDLILKGFSGLPFKNVGKVIVFSRQCSPGQYGQTFMIYVEYKDGEKKEWYMRGSLEHVSIDWEIVEYLNGKDPHNPSHYNSVRGWLDTVAKLYGASCKIDPEVLKKTIGRGSELPGQNGERGDSSAVGEAGPPGKCGKGNNGFNTTYGSGLTNGYMTTGGVNNVKIHIPRLNGTDAGLYGFPLNSKVVDPGSGGDLPPEISGTHATSTHISTGPPGTYGKRITPLAGLGGPSDNEAGRGRESDAARPATDPNTSAPDAEGSPPKTPECLPKQEPSVISNQDNASTQGGIDTNGAQDTQTPQAAPKHDKVVGLLTGSSALWTIFGASSGTLTGAGATFFGGWKLYNRYKGDPWVRQI